jgi:hypothetical protein
MFTINEELIFVLIILYNFHGSSQSEQVLSVIEYQFSFSQELHLFCL